MKKELREAFEGLTLKQRKTLVNYLVTHDAQQAGIDAGYSPKVAGVMASRLMAKPKVRAIVAAMEGKELNRIRLSKRKILRQILYGLDKNLGDYLNDDGTQKTPGQMSRRAKQMVDGYDQEVYETLDREGNVVGRKIKNKLRTVPKATALDMAIRLKGMYKPTQTESKNINLDAQVDWAKVAGVKPFSDEEEIQRRIEGQVKQ